MTPRFILDENVVIRAQLGTDQNGDPSPVCADLVQQIIDICHTLIVDDALWDRYEEQLHRPRHEHPTLGSHLMRVLWNALVTAGKVDGLGHNALSFDDEGAIPPVARMTPSLFGSQSRPAPCSSQPTNRSAGNCGTRALQPSMVCRYCLRKKRRATSDPINR